MTLLYTKTALALLEAALAADRQQLEALAQRHPGAAKQLRAVLEPLEQQEERLTRIAGTGIQALELSVGLLIKNGHFAREVKRIERNAGDVARAVSELSASAVEVAELANQAAERAQESRERTAAGTTGLGSLQEDVELLGSAVRGMAAGVEQFLQFTADIDRLTATVKEIAEQTNLLALNASIEAARAGEAGRGFAVVAQEVKQLAHKSADATEEIESVTEAMNRLSHEVGEKVQTSFSRLDASIDTMSNVGKALSEGQAIVNDVSDRIGQIATAADQQSDVSRAMAANLGEVTAAIESESTQINEVSQLARQMGVQVVQQFNQLGAWPIEALQLQGLKADHLMWKVRVAETVLGGKSMIEGELTDERKSRFGRWYYGEGAARHGQESAFRALERPHQALHALAADIKRLVEAGQQEEATRRLERMDALSAELFQHLDQLAHQARG